MNKASGGEEISTELFKILKDDAVKVLHQCQESWKTQQCPQNWKRSVFIIIPQKRAMPKKVQTIVQLLSFHMLARLCSKSFEPGFSSTWTESVQIYKLDFEEAEDPEIKLPTYTRSWRKQGSFRIKKKRKKNYFCFIDSPTAFDCVNYNKLENSERDRSTRPPYLSPEKLAYGSRNNS